MRPALRAPMSPIDLTLLRETLVLHDRAYRLLLWLGDAARHAPELLSADNEAALADARACAAWLRSQRGLLPPPIVLESQIDTLAALLSSFFRTSFHVQRFEWE